MEFTNLLLEIENGIATITINRPKALNALNRETLEELGQAFRALKKNAEVSVVILTGGGEKAFVAGADIAEMQAMTVLEAREFSAFGQQVMAAIEKLDKPVIAAVNGYALGGGCELAMACDIRVVGEKARFGLPEVSLGVIPGFGGTQRLGRLVGKGRAKELVFTGDMIGAEEAYRIGLANQIVPAGELLEKCKEMAVKIVSKGSVAVRLSKEAINQGMELDIDKAVAYETELFSLCFATDDQKEGMQAFVEKRTADFKGC